VSEDHPRLRRESRTLAAMIRLYCHQQHHTAKGQCSECSELLVYANERLDRCPFQEGKTTCSKCPIHCYKPDMRLKIRQVMRYAGPRMIYQHPLMAVLHMIDGLRQEPVKPASTEES
jgi:hypothetical protein